jgi:hypothetical protein
MDKEALTRTKVRFDQAAEKFYQSGMRFLATLDGWIEARDAQLKQSNGGLTRTDVRKDYQCLASPLKVELRELRQQREEAEELLRRLFPDEFADTCSAAE